MKIITNKCTLIQRRKVSKILFAFAIFFTLHVSKSKNKIGKGQKEMRIIKRWIVRGVATFLIILYDYPPPPPPF